MKAVHDCNITKRRANARGPEHITITDNAIIPLKERVVDEFDDPLTRLFRVYRAFSERGIREGMTGGVQLRPGGSEVGVALTCGT